jgi:hypothetical protein
MANPLLPPVVAVEGEAEWGCRLLLSGLPDGDNDSTN